MTEWEKSRESSAARRTRLGISRNLYQPKLEPDQRRSDFKRPTLFSRTTWPLMTMKLKTEWVLKCTTIDWWWSILLSFFHLFRWFEWILYLKKNKLISQSILIDIFVMFGITQHLVYKTSQMHSRHKHYIFNWCSVYWHSWRSCCLYHPHRYLWPFSHFLIRLWPES